MSVSRVVIRLEIADRCKSVDFNYQGTEQKVELPLQSYASASTSSSHRQNQLTEEQIQIYKGRREYHSITIETYSSEAMNELTNADIAASSEHYDLPTSVHSDHIQQGGTDQVLFSSMLKKPPGPDDPGRDEDTAQSDSAKFNFKAGQKLSSSLIHFCSGNPAVEVTEGILHLYKENHMTSMTGDVPRSDLICMLNVPATLTSHDLIQYLAPIEPNLKQIKIIRGSTPNEYMVLLKFRNQLNADEFFNNFNNEPFNSIEPEICHMVYVARVESLHSSEGAGLQIPGATELPQCTVCLERMDESVDGILTILCNHSFHSSCLTNWEDSSCPVCRYIQTPTAVADNRCFECGAHDDLWICLICGVVGCGRYANGHAYGHFTTTSHTYSMQLGGNCVWDYAGDNYVHRLVQNKADGKLVEVDEQGNRFHEKKMDQISLEYSYLLSNQLESQRKFFEEKIQFIETHKNRQIEELEMQVKKAVEECTRRDEQVAILTKEKLAAEKRCNQLTIKVTKLTADLEEEREMNRCLRENQVEWQSRVSTLEQRLTNKDKEVAELQDQLRDVMFYLDAKDKLEASEDVTQEELQEGQIVVQPTPSASVGPSSERRKKHRKKAR